MRVYWKPYSLKGKVSILSEAFEKGIMSTQSAGNGYKFSFASHIVNWVKIKKYCNSEKLTLSVATRQ